MVQLPLQSRLNANLYKGNASHLLKAHTLGQTPSSTESCTMATQKILVIRSRMEIWDTRWKTTGKTRGFPSGKTYQSSGNKKPLRWRLELLGTKDGLPS